jgi:hypothetical protein
MSNIRLKAGLPNGEANGLRDVADQFIDNPDDMKLALVLLDTKAVTEDRDAGDTTALARVRRIEVISRPDDVKELQRIMLRANEERTGKAVLPFDTEKSIDAVFSQFADEAPTDDKPHDND